MKLQTAKKIQLQCVIYSAMTISTASVGSSVAVIAGVATGAAYPMQEISLIFPQTHNLLCRYDY